MLNNIKSASVKFFGCGPQQENKRVVMINA